MTNLSAKGSTPSYFICTHLILFGIDVIIGILKLLLSTVSALPSKYFLGAPKLAKTQSEPASHHEWSGMLTPFSPGLCHRWGSLAVRAAVIT